MADFQIRSDNVDVEQIMRQIRARIREKRGVDYTEQEIRELADAKLDRFLDPRGVRSDLIEQFKRRREENQPPNYKFEDSTIYDTHRPVLRFIRRMLNPILKLFFNPAPIADALHIQSKLNSQQAWLEPLYYEMIHNLVIETTRLGIEVKNLKMRLESMSSRLDFDERRARALEGVVQYRPGAVPPLQPPTGAVNGGTQQTGNQERRTRRRRRRGRKLGSVRPPAFAGARNETSGGTASAPAGDTPDTGSGSVHPAHSPSDSDARTTTGRGEPSQTEPVSTKPPGEGPGEVG